MSKIYLDPMDNCYPVGADRPAKRQKKTSCVSTSWPVLVLCIRQVAHHTSFLSRQRDVTASFSFVGVLCRRVFNISRFFERKSVHYDAFSTFFALISVEVLTTYHARIYIKKSAGNAP